MWKQVIAFIKSSAATYRRLAQADENIKKLQTRADSHDDGLEDAEETLIKVLHEFEKVRMQMESDKQIAERDREILLLRLDAALKNDTRALPPGFSNQNTPELQAQIDALKAEFAELKAQLAALTASLNEFKAAQEKANTTEK